MITQTYNIRVSFCNELNFTVSKLYLRYKSFYGLKPQKRMSYHCLWSQLCHLHFSIATQFTQWETPNRSRPRLITSNGVRDGSLIYWPLSLPLPRYIRGPPSAPVAQCKLLSKQATATARNRTWSAFIQQNAFLPCHWCGHLDYMVVRCFRAVTDTSRPSHSQMFQQNQDWDRGLFDRKMWNILFV